MERKISGNFVDKIDWKSVCNPRTVIFKCIRSKRKNIKSK